MLLNGFLRRQDVLGWYLGGDDEDWCVEQLVLTGLSLREACDYLGVNV